MMNLKNYIIESLFDIDDNIDKKHVNYNVVATIKKGKNVLKIKTSS